MFIQSVKAYRYIPSYHTVLYYQMIKLMNKLFRYWMLWGLSTWILNRMLQKFSRIPPPCDNTVFIYDRVHPNMYAYSICILYGNFGKLVVYYWNEWGSPNVLSPLSETGFLMFLLSRILPSEINFKLCSHSFSWSVMLSCSTKKIIYIYIYIFFYLTLVFNCHPYLLPC